MGLLERLAELVSFDTRNPEGDEKPLVHKLARDLSALGAAAVDEVEVGEHAYVYARFGAEPPTLLRNAHVDTVPTNSGFVLSYSEQPASGGRPVGPVVGRTIMQCLDPNLVPVISALAQNFVVCDRWFSSVPGPTWPNRFFLHAATANGLLDTPETPGQLASKFFSSPYRMRSIFENLMDAGHSWKVYFDDYAQTFALRNLHPHVDRFVRFEEFARDVASGALPEYSFIEPRGFSAPGWPANDQHHRTRCSRANGSSPASTTRSGPGRRLARVWWCSTTSTVDSTIT
jgi:hypothetical protein